MIDHQEGLQEPILLLSSSKKTSHPKESLPLNQEKRLVENHQLENPLRDLVQSLDRNLDNNLQARVRLPPREADLQLEANLLGRNLEENQLENLKDNLNQELHPRAEILARSQPQNPVRALVKRAAVAESNQHRRAEDRVVLKSLPLTPHAGDLLLNLKAE